MNTTKKTEKALFAGGCFWCMEKPFDIKEGVLSSTSGYAGGKKESPTYKEVSKGGTGHVEAILIEYDPTKVSYTELLEIFWKQIDPADNKGQFNDKGAPYLSRIFYYNEEQKKAALDSKEKLKESKIFSSVVTEILPYTNFYKAEEYHQDYYKKNPIRYAYYYKGSGRASFLKKTWDNNTFQLTKTASKKMNSKTYSRPSKETIKSKLSPTQFKVTQKDGTEAPYKNEYWDNKKEGIYVDIVSNEPLFSSLHKYDSGTGWPSFSQPISKEYITTKSDFKLLYKRTEVRSKYGNSHLGHIFKDGPKPTGLRYCINSAALRFIPVEKLKEEGYGEYLKDFKK